MDAEKLHELLVEGLRDLYNAEEQLVKALPKMARAADSDPVRTALQDHLAVTRKQVERLERVFSILGENAKGRPCKGMKGLIEEGEEHMSEHQDELIDAVLIEAGKKVEHYEMAAYAGALELADLLGERQAARLLRQTLTEEERMEKKLVAASGKLLKAAMRKAA